MPWQVQSHIVKGVVLWNVPVSTACPVAGAVDRWLLSAYLASHDILPDSRVNYRQPVFAVRVLRIWNSLAEDVVSAAHLSLFISRLVRVNLN